MPTATLTGAKPVTPAASADLTVIKARQKAAWSSGNYAVVGTTLQIVGEELCEALDVLHRNGLIHGDVSPRNLIVSGSDLVLTDYDFVGKIGEVARAPGTVIYSSPSYNERRPGSPSPLPTHS